MSGLRTYRSLRTLVTRLRDDLTNPTNEIQVVLLYAYNRTGKTRLSMDFKDQGKRKTRKNPDGNPDTLYFNAYTEDLFTWENDLEGDAERYLRFNDSSNFFDGLAEMEMDNRIRPILQRYVNFDFRIFPAEASVVFSDLPFTSEDNETRKKIKISRGEENIFKWCFFMAVAQLVIDGAPAYQWVKYLYIDDPISSLDDNNAIAVACDLAKLLRRAARRTDVNGAPAPVKVIFSSHHSLFFNVMCNEMRKVSHRRYFLHRPNGDGAYILRATEDTPFFHHVAILAELQRAAEPSTGTLFTHHFNSLRSIMEKTTSFFGHADISFCLQALNEENEALYNRALNLLSHGGYSIFEPTEMSEDNKALFRRMLNDFITRFDFVLPEILGRTTTPASP